MIVVEGGIGANVVQAPIIEGHEFSAWVAGLGEGADGPAVDRRRRDGLSVRGRRRSVRPSPGGHFNRGNRR